MIITIKDVFKILTKINKHARKLTGRYCAGWQDCIETIINELEKVDNKTK